MKSAGLTTSNLQNVLVAALVLLALVIFYAFLSAYGFAANVALAFTLLGGCILCLVLFTIRIGRGRGAGQHHDH